MAIQCFTKDISAAACAGDDNSSVSWIPSVIIGDSESDVVEPQFSGQNNSFNLSEDSVAQSSRSQPAWIRNGSFDNETLLFPSTPLQTMKRSDSLPNSLLRYVSSRT